MNSFNVYRLLLGLAVIFIFKGCSGPESVPVKKIAYVGRYTDCKAAEAPDNRFDQMHEYILKNYLKELNAEGGAVKFELVTFDCRRDSAGADSVYKLIAADPSIVAVVDNSWGAHIRGAAKIIKEKSIPVVAINADRNGLNFGSSAIFMGNNDMLPGELALFLKKVLEQKKVILISESDYPLHFGYLEAFNKAGIDLADSFQIRYNAEDKNLEFENLCRKIKTAFEARPELKDYYLVINLHNEYGTRLINRLDTDFKNLKMIGHAYITQTVSSHVFGVESGNELVLVTNPTDAVSAKITADLKRYKAERPEIFSEFNSPLFPKRCQDAVAIIAGALTGGTSETGYDRSHFATYFASLRSGTLESKHDLFDFNAQNELIPELYYTHYKEGRLYSYPQQLNSRGQIVPNLIFGMEIIDLYNIDVSTNTFQSDFYYWVKIDTGTRDAEKFVLFQNMKEAGSGKELVLEKEENGLLYKLYKVSGLFYCDYNLKDYPFDKQEVMMKVEIMNSTDKVKISFDQSGFHQDKNLLDRFKVRAWNKTDYFLTVDNRISSTMRGDPSSVEGQLKKFQVFTFRLFVKRAPMGPFLEIILPLFLIGAVAISLLYVRDISFGNLGDVSVGTFLAIITFSLAISNVSPSSDYLTKSDLLFWCTFAVVLNTFLTIIVTNAIFRDEDLKDVKFVKRVRLIITVLYPIVCGCILLW